MKQKARRQGEGMRWGGMPARPKIRIEEPKKGSFLRLSLNLSVKILKLNATL
ncbi:MAG: hypothetical protein ACK5IJ_08195 [Mangrovibacterium sp.]